MVVRQQGSSQDAAGQGPEHEVARVVSPLLFSLADPEAGPMAQLRVGNAHLQDSQPQWCHPFPLQIGSNVLRLRVSQKDKPDFVYIIGIHIRYGKGRHRRTKIITLSPRFHLHNKSSYQLQFSLHCLATTLVSTITCLKYYILLISIRMIPLLLQLTEKLFLSVLSHGIGLGLIRSFY